MTDSPKPIRFVVAGAGPMGRFWIDALEDNPDVELVGVADMREDLARSAVPRDDVPTGTDPVALALDTGADALLNATIPQAHHPVGTAAMRAGLAVLCEKPLAPTVAQALSIAAVAEHTGRLHMTSQSRRYYAALDAFRAQLRALGDVGLLNVGFYNSLRVGGFREEMAAPLLVDMAIHQFDIARFVLDADPVAVTCHSYDTSWSWYAGDASAIAMFEFEGERRFTFTGSWVTPGLQTSPNGEWRGMTENGAVTWDGHRSVRVQRADGDPWDAEVAEGVPEEIRGALVEFVDAYRTGSTPSGTATRNILSLAMVEAAVQSTLEHRRVRIDETLELAYAKALDEERDPAAREILESWGSAAAATARRRG